MAFVALNRLTGTAIPGFYDQEHRKDFANWPIDEVTGFLTCDVPNAFNAEKKAAVIQYLETKPLSITAACNAVGVARATFFKHKYADKAFRDAVEKIVDERLDEVEEASFQYALEKENSADRKFLLSNWRPEQYGVKAQNPSHGGQLVINFNGATTDAYARNQQILEAEILGASTENNPLADDQLTNTPRNGDNNVA